MTYVNSATDDSMSMLKLEAIVNKLIEIVKVKLSSTIKNFMIIMKELSLLISRNYLKKSFTHL